MVPAGAQPRSSNEPVQQQPGQTPSASAFPGENSQMQPRTSIFKELDISDCSDDEERIQLHSSARKKQVRFRRKPEIHEAPVFTDEEEDLLSRRIGHAPVERKPLPSTVNSSLSQPLTRSSAILAMSRLYVFSLLMAIFLPLLHSPPLIGKAGESAIGVEGGVIRNTARDAEIVSEMGGEMVKRQNSPTDVCNRWAHASAIVNGTIYIYGGQATQEYGQKKNTWNNNFLSLDLSKTWQISTPSLTGLLQPSGPPAVAEAFLWNSFTSLFLYGGEYSSDPVASPSPFALWEYDIGSSSWIQHNNPTTLAGTNSDGGNQPVQDVAEGAGISVPELGRGFYFGGHEDFLTTAGWSDEVARIYLKSLLEFTFPGYPNDGIQSLSGGKTAGSDGAWRNITSGGLQAGDGFPERADGVLVYIPGFGNDGVLLGLAGGTNATYTEINEIDIYNIATSTWYKQATSGTAPGFRVDPCAVAASAADGSSTNVYMFGGQNLPVTDGGPQTQYNDMWILTIPSFTWIEVDQSHQSIPPPRAGHTCNMWDAQMVVFGGYVPANISCDSPGVYVFDVSELKWQNSFTALSGGDDENQQVSQSKNSTGLSGSYGYQVPAAVQSVIGGNSTGGATITAPAQTATVGPLAYTITASSGATVTEKGTPSTVSGGPNPSNPSGTQQQKSGPNIAAIVAGVVAGLFALLAGYLGFCAWVYRRQLALYKNHVAMSQRAAAGAPTEKTGFLYSQAPESSKTKRSTEGSGTVAGSGTGASGSGSGSGPESIPPMPGIGVHFPVGGNSTANSSTEDLITGQEPSFVGVLLNPRRSLRVINRD
ncbi:hypothetical protein MMC14_009274 [Varicellaria rhodocarpa]|nr:hypothetical protein [Varicellaria rhodocarpa]